MMHSSGRATVILVLAAILAATGCGPLVGVRATIRTDDLTRLEREVLGERGEVAPRAVLMPLEPVEPPMTAAQLTSLEAEYEDLEQRLAELRPRTPALRAWETISLHNRGVARWRLGDREGAARLLELAERHARNYWLWSLQWQVELTRARAVPEQREESLRTAARLVMEHPPLTPFDHDLEDAERLDALHGALIGRALEADPEQALRHALDWEAAVLARAVPPGGLRFAPGEMADRVAALDGARAALARERARRCILPVEQAVGPVEGSSAWDSLVAAREGLRGVSPAAGLLVPDPADAMALREGLQAGSLMLVFAPLGDSATAGFALGPEAFAARRLSLPASPEQMARRPDDAAKALLEPFAAEIEGAERLYLAPSPALSGLPWQRLPFGGVPIAQRLPVVFLGGASDWPAAFEQRHYGRDSMLVCAGGEEQGTSFAAAMAERPGVRNLDIRTNDKQALADAMAFVDSVWLGNPVELPPGAPGSAYVVFPGAPGRLAGVSLGELCTYRTRAAVVALAGLPAGAFSPERFLALRVLTRCLFAAGAPTVAYGADGAGATDFWRPFMEGLRNAPAADAHGASLSNLAMDENEYRLYGFAGLSDEAYVEFSRLDFNDTLRAARADLSAGRFEQAAAGFLDLWHMARALPFGSESEKALILANIQRFLVECWRSLRHYELAAEHQRIRIEQLRESGGAGPRDMAREHQTLGALLTMGEQFEAAATAYERSIELLRQEGDPEELAHMLGERGKSLDRAADYEGALEAFREALAIHERLGQPVGIALQHQRIGAVYLKRLSEPIRAEEHFAQARDAYERAGDAGGRLESILDVGLCRRRMGDFAGALRLFEQARAEAEQRDLPETVTRALTEIGNTRWFRGEYQQALELVSQSSAMARELDLPFQLNVNYQLLALIYWELNQYSRAHESLDVAVEQARRAEMPLEVASAHNNRGIIYRRQGLYEQALEWFRRALDIDTRLRSRWGQGYDHRNMGMTLHRMERYEEASGHLERAVEITREIGDRVNLAKSLLALGDLRLDQQRLGDAEGLLEQALAEARDVFLPEVEWRALRGLGRLRREQGDNEGAWDALRQGVEVVETMGAGLKIEEFRSGYLANKMDLYEDAVNLLLDMERPAEAFHYAERSRSRKFMDVVAGRDIELKTDEERELFERQKELNLRMRSLREAVARESGDERREQLAGQVEELEREYADVLLEIQVSHPELSGFVAVEAVTADELAEFVPQGMTLLVYYVLPERVAIWVWDGEVLRARQVAVERDALAGRIRRYRTMVQNRELLGDVRRQSRELNDLLVAPVAELVDEGDTLCIVPHRSLHYLSYASLYDGEAFLVERHPIFYNPSVSVLRRTLAARPPEERSRVRVLAVGNPDVGEAAYALPFTEREVVSIGRTFEQVNSLTGPEATEEQVSSEMVRHDVVHIGAHGILDSGNPLFSSLVLAPRDEDGFLHLYEVTGLDLNAQLLALSACQSGVGQLQSADELVSLSRAFSYAGARAILSTLWRVDDVSTALVSKHFYRQYVERGAAESLRAAQLQVMNDGRHYHPTYWAGVVLSGDYR